MCWVEKGRKVMRRLGKGWGRGEEKGNGRVKG